MECIGVLFSCRNLLSNLSNEVVSERKYVLTVPTICVYTYHIHLIVRPTPRLRPPYFKGAKVKAKNTSETNSQGEKGVLYSGEYYQIKQDVIFIKRTDKVNRMLPVKCQLKALHS